MPRPFIYNRRNGYFADQDYKPDHSYATMRYAGQPCVGDAYEHMPRSIGLRKHVELSR